MVFPFAAVCEEMVVRLPDPEELAIADNGKYDSQSVLRVRALNQELCQYQQRVKSLHSSIHSRDLGQDALRASNPGACAAQGQHRPTGATEGPPREKASAAPSTGGPAMHGLT